MGEIPKGMGPTEEQEAQLLKLTADLPLNDPKAPAPTWLDGALKKKEIAAMDAGAEAPAELDANRVRNLLDAEGKAH